jgi:Spy/CpxP family protein refolding chaperone
MRTIMTTTILGLALLAATPQAMAFGMRGGPGFFGGHGGPGGPGGPGKPLRLLLSQMTADQRSQVRDVLRADRGTMRDTVKALHDAHEALADKLFTAGPLTDTDIAPQVQKIAALHQQLLEHGTKVMLQVRAIATPDQLAKHRWAEARRAPSEMRTLPAGPIRPTRAECSFGGSWGPARHQWRAGRNASSGDRVAWDALGAGAGGERLRQQLGPGPEGIADLERMPRLQSSTMSASSPAPVSGFMSARCSTGSP